MRKKSMSKRQLSERALILEKLRAAKWKGTPINDRFEEGYMSFDEASMEYDGPSMSMRLNYHAETGSVYLSISSESKAIRLRIDHGDKIEPVLDAIVGFQDKVKPGTFRRYVSELLTICQSIFVNLDGKKWTPVVDSDAVAKRSPGPKKPDNDP